MENAPSRNPRKTNWEKYNTNLTNNLVKVTVKKVAKHNLELELAVNELELNIVKAFEESCPQSVKRTMKDVPGWSADLTSLRAETRRLSNKAKRDGNWQVYKQTLTSYNKEIRKAKRSSFRKFCENISSTPAAARLHKSMAKNKKVPSGLLIFIEETGRYFH